MSEYVPTTEAVRSKYARGIRSDGIPTQFVKWQKEFDRWLAGVKAEAWDEGFDAGERDVLGHATFDETCIRNPYREGQGDESEAQASQGWPVEDLVEGRVQ